ncbi:hypothetical protein HJG60_011306 [Phyllostomus discolor]|uniref:Uncharacterized protein n=1 Tax=Phyllostomus discolor TaxID=89673 RepID=A0A834E1N8_9CHIR|nr:hypothetical protein HJG60_011306 [Phyllostomus discolor]
MARRWSPGSQPRTRVLTRNQTRWHHELNFPDSRTMRNKCPLLTPPSQSLALGCGSLSNEDKSLDSVGRSLGIHTLLASYLCATTFSQPKCGVLQHLLPKRTFVHSFVCSFILSADFFKVHALCRVLCCGV